MPRVDVCFVQIKLIYIVALDYFDFKAGDLNEVSLSKGCIVSYLDLHWVNDPRSLAWVPSFLHARFLQVSMVCSFILL
jgi:hypothetical protein